MHWLTNNFVKFLMTISSVIFVYYIVVTVRIDTVTGVAKDKVFQLRGYLSNISSTNISQASNITTQNLTTFFDDGFFVGGLYTPKNQSYSVAIIIPFRNREAHLVIFQNYIHSFLQQQSIAYRIFVIEQEPGDLFNRGSLMNVGFLEASAVQKWDCYIFHDIDLLPKDQNTTYRCYDSPFHMASAINKFGYKLPYKEYTGGVLAMTGEQFRKTNGYSNKFWGWGGEDDDMTYRMQKKGYRVFRLADEVSRYDMLVHDHHKSEEDKDRFSLLKNVTERLNVDGLNTFKYRTMKIEMNLFYTKMLIKLYRS